MEIEIREIDVVNDTTLSSVYIDGRWECFCLEDKPQKTKIMGETRIPGGRYKVVRRLWGKFFTRYKRKWNHKSALELLDVPNFTAIMIHVGYTKDHTGGCLLMGSKPFINNQGDFAFATSESEYRSFYSKVSKRIDEEDVYINIVRKSAAI